MLRTLIFGCVIALLAQSAAASIFSCTDKNGRRHTADRPIADCLDQQQRILNPDGSLKTILPAAMSPRERNAAEGREREAERVKTAAQESIKRDRLLLRRYPNTALHQAARVDALRQVNASIEATRQRIEALQTARQPLQVEAARFEGKSIPGDLKQRLNANDAMQKAQRSLEQNQTLEAERINRRYDEEVARLTPFWKSPGSSTTSGDPR
ncbi:MAG: DUF4124 domain-containing protein [Ideonella sp.]